MRRGSTSLTSKNIGLISFVKSPGASLNGGFWAQIPKEATSKDGPTHGTGHPVRYRSEFVDCEAVIVDHLGCLSSDLVVVGEEEHLGGVRQPVEHAEASLRPLVVEMNE